MESKSGHSSVEDFWRSYLASMSPGTADLPLPQAWGFGDSAAMADELGALVRSGTKTATCSMLWEYEATGEPLPQVGQLNIILDGEGCPLCIVETTEIEIKPYDEVDAQFAFDEGEGDRSLDYWRQAHWRYFSRVGPAFGKDVSSDMPLVCERFRVVYR